MKNKKQHFRLIENAASLFGISKYGKMHFLRWYYPDQVHGYNLSLAAARRRDKTPRCNYGYKCRKTCDKIKKLLWEVNLCPLICSENGMAEEDDELQKMYNK